MSSTEGAEKSGPEEPVAAAEDVAEVETTDPDKASSSRSRGIVKWFSVTKGYGFVEPHGGGAEVFVHQTSIRTEGFRSLKEGEEVEFDLDIGEDGRGKATHVTGPDGAPPQGAPKRVELRSAPPYALMPPQPPQIGYYDPYTGYAQPILRGGRYPGRGYIMPGRGPFPYGRGYVPPLERPPPPGTPGYSSGFQVVVHNLPWSVTWQELKDLFSHTPGMARADVIIDATGRSRGFGTVRYKSREEALQAAEMMNNAEIGGRIVTVRIDRFA